MKFRLTVLLALIYFGISASDSPLWMRYSSISPDGEWIAFSYQGDIYKVPSSGGQAVILTIHEAHDYMPVWSHDGKTLAFSSDRYGNFDVYTVSSSGGKSTRLTYHSAGDFPSDFSPDGSKIIFTSSRMDDHKNQQYPSGVLSELYSVPATGGR